jgi:hypothetical protein
MISRVFTVLRDALLDYLQRRTGFTPTDAASDLVVFPSSDKLDAIDIKLGAISMLLVNVEEDRRARPADPFRRPMPDGSMLVVHAPVPLNIHILFVPRFTDYLESLKYLSLVAQFFQAHRMIDRELVPALGDDIEKLICELITTPVTEDNHVWRGLAMPYQPSLLYRIRMVVLQDAIGMPTATPNSVVVGVNQ